MTYADFLERSRQKRARIVAMKAAGTCAEDIARTLTAEGEQISGARVRSILKTEAERVHGPKPKRRRKPASASL